LTDDQFARAKKETAVYARTFYPSLSLEVRSYLGIEDLEQMGMIKLANTLPKWDPAKASLKTFFGHCLVNYYRTVIRDSKTWDRDTYQESVELLDLPLDFAVAEAATADQIVAAAEVIDALLAAASSDLQAILQTYFTGEADHYKIKAVEVHREELSKLLIIFDVSAADFRLAAAL